MTMLPPYLTDTELAEICSPLVTGAAQSRYLSRLGLKVARKPNGKPLVARAEWERVMVGALPNKAERASNEPDRMALMQLLSRKGAPHGAQTA